MRFDASEEEVVFVAAVSTAEETRTVIGVRVVESQEKTFFLVIRSELPVKVCKGFVHFVDQSLRLTEWDEGYCFACLITPGVVA